MIGPRAGAYRRVMLHGVDRLHSRRPAACYPRRRRAVADIASPHTPRVPCYLNDGLGGVPRAMDGLTVRPRAPGGAGFNGGYSTPLHPRPRASALGKPARGAFVLPATHDGGFASRAPFRGPSRPENPD